MIYHLSFAKLANGGSINTDGANAVQGYSQSLVEEIQKEAILRGMIESKIKIFEGDCWHHMHNICFGAVIKALNSDLCKSLEYNVNEIHSIMRVSTNLVELYCAMEK